MKTLKVETSHMQFTSLACYVIAQQTLSNTGEQRGRGSLTLYLQISIIARLTEVAKLSIQIWPRNASDYVRDVFAFWKELGSFNRGEMF